MNTPSQTIAPLIENYTSEELAQYVRSTMTSLSQQWSFPDIKEYQEAYKKNTSLGDTRIYRDMSSILDNMKGEEGEDLIDDEAKALLLLFLVPELTRILEKKTIVTSANKSVSKYVQEVDKVMVANSILNERIKYAREKNHNLSEGDFPISPSIDRGMVQPFIGGIAEAMAVCIAASFGGTTAQSVSAFFTSTHLGGWKYLLASAPALGQVYLLSKMNQTFTEIRAVRTMHEGDHMGNTDEESVGIDEKTRIGGIRRVYNVACDMKNAISENKKLAITSLLLATVIEGGGAFNNTAEPLIVREDAKLRFGAAADILSKNTESITTQISKKLESLNQTMSTFKKGVLDGEKGRGGKAGPVYGIKNQIFQQQVLTISGSSDVDTALSPYKQNLIIPTEFTVNGVVLNGNDLFHETLTAENYDSLSSVPFDQRINILTISVSNDLKKVNDMNSEFETFLKEPVNHSFIESLTGSDDEKLTSYEELKEARDNLSSASKKAFSQIDDKMKFMGAYFEATARDIKMIDTVLKQASENNPKLATYKQETIIPDVKIKPLDVKSFQQKLNKSLPTGAYDNPVETIEKIIKMGKIGEVGTTAIARAVIILGGLSGILFGLGGYNSVRRNRKEIQLLPKHLRELETSLDEIALSLQTYINTEVLNHISVDGNEGVEISQMQAKGILLQFLHHIHPAYKLYDDPSWIENAGRAVTADGRPEWIHDFNNLQSALKKWSGSEKLSPGEREEEISKKLNQFLFGKTGQFSQAETPFRRILKLANAGTDISKLHEERNQKYNDRIEELRQYVLSPGEKKIYKEEEEKKRTQKERIQKNQGPILSRLIKEGTLETYFSDLTTQISGELSQISGEKEKDPKNLAQELFEVDKKEEDSLAGETFDSIGESDREIYYERAEKEVSEFLSLKKEKIEEFQEILGNIKKVYADILQFDTWEDDASSKQINDTFLDLMSAIQPSSTDEEKGAEGNSEKKNGKSKELVTTIKNFLQKIFPNTRSSGEDGIDFGIINRPPEKKK